jgi:hypothetical protein
MAEEDAERIGGDEAGKRGARIVDRIKIAADAEKRPGNGNKRQDFAAAHERLKQHQERAKAAPNELRQYAKDICGVGERGHLAGSEPFH